MVNVTLADLHGNPLPAGVQYNAYVGTKVLASPAVSGFISFGATVSLSGSTQYTLNFSGTQAPESLCTFTTPVSGSYTATVPQYISPSPNQTGFASLQTQLWPRGWFSDSAMISGGVAYNLAYALAWANAQMDQQIQTTTSAARLQSSIGGMIDSWAYDYFGNNLPRNPGESDASYIGRIEAMLAAKQSTPAGVNAVANFFGTAWIDEPWRTAETGAWDTNGVFAWDSIGGWGDQLSGIQVYVEPNSGVNTQYLKSTVIASRPIGMPTEVCEVVGTDQPIAMSTWSQNSGPNREGVIASVPADGSSATAVSHTAPYSYNHGAVRFGLANYNGGDNASLRVRIVSAPSLSGFSAIVSGGTSGSTVTLHYRASGDIGPYAIPL